jgi:hypothetical protein
LENELEGTGLSHECLRGFDGIYAGLQRASSIFVDKGRRNENVFEVSNSPPRDKLQRASSELTCRG